MISKGVAQKTFLIVTLVITVPLCVVCVYFAEQQRKIVLMENERQLSQISATLAQRIPQNGRPIVFWNDKYSKDEQKAAEISAIQEFYQPFVDKLAELYPQNEFGIFHRNWGMVVASYPSSGPAIQPDQQAVTKVYDTRENVTAIANSGNDGSAVMMAISPIFHLGDIVGYAWVSKKINHIWEERNAVVLKGIVIIVWLWLMLTLIIQYVFYKLDWSLIRFSNHVADEQITESEFRDFPQLEPVFKKIVDLRANLKKETEHYLEENQKIKKIIEMTPLAVFLVDKDGVISDCNRAFLKYYPGYTKRTVTNLSYRALAEGSNRKYESTVIARALKGEEIRDEYDNFLNRSWISNAFPIKNKCGEIIGAISIGHDITEYELLRKEILRLDRLNIVGQMAASVAHEVRNPMTVARGYIQRLLMKTGDTYSTQFNTVIEELDRANNIINNFLSLARNKYVEKRDESLGKIISDIYPLIESEALERNMNCRMILQENLPKLLLNTEEMKQLILNLSMNALDAMDEHGELVLSCEFQQGAGEVILSVSDTGCGIDADNLAMVFDPFYTTKKAGSGLGLPVCKSIVERHGAAICVHSEPGKGTVFAVRFPVEKSEQSI